MQYGWLLLTLACTLLSIVVRAYRWKYLLAPIQPVRFPGLFTATSIGLMANNLLPARLGEPIRAYLLGEQACISKSASLATLVVERVFDVTTVLLILGMTLLVWPAPGWVGRIGGVVLLADLAVLVGLAMLRAWPHFLPAMTEAVLSLVSRRVAAWTAQVLRSFADGLQVLGQWKVFGQTVLWSGVLWAIVGISIWSVFQAFDLSLPLIAPWLVLAVVSLGLIVPSGPGFVGTFEFSMVSSLALFGVGESQGLSVAVVYHATQFIPTVAIGLVSLWLDSSLSLPNLRMLGRRERREISP